MNPLLLLAMACAPESDDTATTNGYTSSTDDIPAVETTFIEPETDSAHQLDDPKEVIYRTTQDRYCESEMTLELTVPESTSAVPKVYVGYFSDDAGWEDSNAGNLDGLDESDTLEVRSSGRTEAVSLNDNIHSTSEAGVYEFSYVPAQDGLIDSLAWSFDLFVTATDGDEHGPIEQWSYRNTDPSDDCH